MPWMVQAVEVVTARLSTLLGTLVGDIVREMDRRYCQRDRQERDFRATLSLVL